uniref:Uncharacterized protein n=1 Tax=Anopheles atroparvus TaxID=41427 RepID=A0AAG5CSN7_ANOAO
MAKAGRRNGNDRLDARRIHLAPVPSDAGRVPNADYAYDAHRLLRPVRVSQGKRGQLQRVAQVEIALVDEYPAERGELAGHLEHDLLQQILPLALLNLLDADVVVHEQQLRYQLHRLPEGQTAQGALQCHLDLPVAQLYHAVRDLLRFLHRTPELAAGRHAELLRELGVHVQQQNVEKPIDRAVRADDGTHFGQVHLLRLLEQRLLVVLENVHAGRAQLQHDHVRAHVAHHQRNVPLGALAEVGRPDQVHLRTARRRQQRHRLRQVPVELLQGGVQWDRRIATTFRRQLRYVCRRVPGVLLPGRAARRGGRVRLRHVDAHVRNARCAGRPTDPATRFLRLVLRADERQDYIVERVGQFAGADVETERAGRTVEGASVRGLTQIIVAQAVQQMLGGVFHIFLLLRSQLFVPVSANVHVFYIWKGKTAIVKNPTDIKALRACVQDLTAVAQTGYI